MLQIFRFALVFLAGEVVANVTFFLMLRFWFRAKYERRPAAKGVLERFFLLLALAQGIPQALILFGALKIGTRIRTEDSIDSDYYLIGNLVSASFALLYAAVLAAW